VAWVLAWLRWHASGRSSPTIRDTTRTLRGATSGVEQPSVRRRPDHPNGDDLCVSIGASRRSARCSSLPALSPPMPRPAVAADAGGAAGEAPGHTTRARTAQAGHTIHARPARAGHTQDPSRRVPGSAGARRPDRTRPAPRGSGARRQGPGAASPATATGGSSGARRRRANSSGRPGIRGAGRGTWSTTSCRSPAAGRTRRATCSGRRPRRRRRRTGSNGGGAAAERAGGRVACCRGSNRFGELGDGA
jgi:hypothetical protein